MQESYHAGCSFPHAGKFPHGNVGHKNASLYLSPFNLQVHPFRRKSTKFLKKQNMLPMTHFQYLKKLFTVLSPHLEAPAALFKRESSDSKASITFLSRTSNQFCLEFQSDLQQLSKALAQL